MKNVFIVGSKPEAVFPDLEPDAIYAANGPISRVVSDYDCRKVAVLNRYALSRKWVHVGSEDILFSDAIILFGSDSPVSTFDSLDVLKGYPSCVTTDSARFPRKLKYKNFCFWHTVRENISTNVRWVE